MNGRPADIPAAPTTSPRLVLALPWTTYVYLFLLLVSFAAPTILKQILPDKGGVSAVQEDALTEQDFVRYVAAEESTRSSYVLGTVEAPGSHKKESGSLLGAAFRSQRRSSVVEAIDDYQKLHYTTHAVNMDRRVLILRHLLGEPLDQHTLNAFLRPDLRIAGATSSEIDAELRLWRAIYGGLMLPSAAVPGAVQRVRRMDLHFLQDQALEDVYNAAGQAANAAAAKDRLGAHAMRFFVVMATYVTFGCIGFLVGIVLLLLFLIAAQSHNWRNVKRVATAKLRLGWGDLMDGFVFYIAIYRFTGLCVGAALRNNGASLAPHALLSLEAIMQIGIGVVAIGYLAAKARRNGTTLADIGLRLNGSIWSEIGYGIVGYCAGLPLLVALGLIARFVFRNNTDVTPNGILPLMVGTHDPLSRTLIFLMASLAAPFIEETFFRGALFTGLRTRYGWSVSALISACCFAVVHPMQDWLPIFGLGFYFATMREMRQSLVPSMTAHFLQNTVSFIVLTNLFSS